MKRVRKISGLKVVLMESGVSWLPAFMWRANKTARRARRGALGRA